MKRSEFPVDWEQPPSHDGDMGRWRMRMRVRWHSGWEPVRLRPCSPWDKSLSVGKSHLSQIRLWGVIRCHYGPPDLLSTNAERYGSVAQLARDKGPRFESGQSHQGAWAPPCKLYMPRPVKAAPLAPVQFRLGKMDGVAQRPGASRKCGAADSRGGPAGGATRKEIMSGGNT